MCEISRRRFVRGTAALGATGSTGLFSSPLMAQARRGDGGSAKLPARGEFTIANAYVKQWTARSPISPGARFTCATARSSRSART